MKVETFPALPIPFSGIIHALLLYRPTDHLPAHPSPLWPDPPAMAVRSVVGRPLLESCEM